MVFEMGTAGGSRKASVIETGLPGVPFVCTYLDSVPFGSAFTTKKPLLSTKAKEVSLLRLLCEYDIITASNCMETEINNGTNNFAEDRYC